MKLLLLFLLAVPLTGCGSDPATPADDHADEGPVAHAGDEGHGGDADSDETTLTEAQAAAVAIETGSVSAAALSLELRVPARIVSTVSGSIGSQLRFPQ